MPTRKKAPEEYERLSIRFTVELLGDTGRVKHILSSRKCGPYSALGEQDAAALAFDRAIRELTARLGSVDGRAQRAPAPDPKHSSVDPATICCGHDGGKGPPCCERAGDYCGWGGGEYPRDFSCLKRCSCHD